MHTHASPAIITAPTTAQRHRDRELAITRNLELVAKAMSGLASQLVPLHLPALEGRSRRPIAAPSDDETLVQLRSA
ncbi:MAG: hypothetical protein M3396_00585 [Actinomycetota bacterium]|nr:hypothetical protein [Actinomycetota bacterium]MDQ3574590.1 hypothetical protein [Actinomycetota bacterium]